MSDLYILVDGEPMQEPDTVSWGMWYELHGQERVVAQEYVGKDWVSTVFLGINHNFMGNGAPILYETMVFYGPHADLMKRYTTHGQAIEGHRSIVALLHAELDVYPADTEDAT